jgi:hypothetical protein
VEVSILKRTGSSLKGSQRFADPAAKLAAGLPGPGQYSVPAGVGRQAVSTKSTKPIIAFTKADRDASRKVCIIMKIPSKIGNIAVTVVCCTAMHALLGRCADIWFKVQGWHRRAFDQCNQICLLQMSAFSSCIPETRHAIYQATLRM